MNDERFLKDWLRETSDTDEDSESAADRIMAKVPETAQRSRWWPLRRARRREVAASRSSRDIDGRTRSMFSPSAVTGGALVLALGGLLLVALPAAEPRGAPGAETTTDAVPSLFLGRVSPTGAQVHLGSATAGVRDDGSSFDYGYGYENSFVTTDDPRFTGRLDWIFNIENPAPVVPGTQPAGEISTVLVRISNDDGAWSGTTTAVIRSEPAWESLSGWLVGEGEYEGLMAYVAMDTNVWKVMGYVTPYGPPPVPEGFPSESAD